MGKERIRKSVNMKLASSDFLDQEKLVKIRNESFLNRGNGNEFDKQTPGYDEIIRLIKSEREKAAETAQEKQTVEIAKRLSGKLSDQEIEHVTGIKINNI